MTDYVDDCNFRPAYNSLTGYFLTAIEDTCLNELQFSSGAIDAVRTVAARVLVALVVVLTSIVDFALLLGMTIAVFPLILYPKSHITNVTSSLANIGLGFAIVGGREIKVNEYRRICGTDIPEYPEILWARSETLVREMTVLRDKIVNQTPVQNKQQSATLLKELIPYLGHQRIMQQPSDSAFQDLRLLIKAMIDHGVDINHPIQPNEYDYAECYLIHYLTQLLYESTYQPENLSRAWTLIEMVLNAGADPHKRMITGRGSITPVPSHPDLKDVILEFMPGERILEAHQKWGNKLRLDQPMTSTFSENAERDGGLSKVKIESSSAMSLIRKNPILRHIYNDNLHYGKRDKAVAALLEIGITLSDQEKQVVKAMLKHAEAIKKDADQITAQQAKEGLTKEEAERLKSEKYNLRIPHEDAIRVLSSPSIRLLNALQEGASFEDRIWAARQFACLQVVQLELNVITIPEQLSVIQDKLNQAAATAYQINPIGGAYKLIVALFPETDKSDLMAFVKIQQATKDLKDLKDKRQKT